MSGSKKVVEKLAYTRHFHEKHYRKLEAAVHRHKHTISTVL